MNNKTAIEEIAKLIQNKEADKADTGLIIGLEVLKTLKDISAQLTILGLQVGEDANGITVLKISNTVFLSKALSKYYRLLKTITEDK
jgi:hypothetical protein